MQVQECVSDGRIGGHDTEEPLASSWPLFSEGRV
jgi:hypothetical protein